MRHATAFSLAVLTLVVAGLAARSGTLLLLALPFVFYLAAALLAGPHRLDLKVTRTLAEERVRAEAPVTVRVTVTNRGPAVRELHLRDEIPIGLRVIEGEPARLMSLAAGAARTFTYAVAGPRGVYHFRTLRATAREPFDLVRRDAVIAVAADLFAYQLPGATLRRVDIRPRRTRVYSGTIAARAGGEGTDFYAVRNYRQGDPLRRINWKASARRRDALFTNEFEQERVADVGLILDARRASNLPHGRRSLLDYSVEAAAVLADVLLNQGNRVALLTYGTLLDYTLPGYGKVQRKKIMDALARAQLGESQVFQELAALPTRLFPAQSQIVFISPLLENDVPFLRRLRAFGYQVMLISPDPVGYEMARLGEKAGVDFAARLARLERERLLRSLRQAGIFVLDWDVEEAFHEVAHARLRARPLRQ